MSLTNGKDSRQLLTVLGAIVVLVALSNALIAQDQDDSKRQKIVKSVLDASGGGTQDGEKWALRNHWVGELKPVVVTGGYQKGGHLAPRTSAKSVRLSTFRADLRGNYSIGGFTYRDSLPTIEQLKDSQKHLEILASFGDQHGWTDAWGNAERMHWSEGWRWFSLTDDGRVRVLAVFAHVSGANGKGAEKSIDHMIIREGLLEKSDPTNADDLKRFPTAESMLNKRQQKIEQDDLKYPAPLRTLLQAKHTPGDSDLKAYFAAIKEFRKNPDPKLLKQLVAHLDDSSMSFVTMADYLFDPTLSGGAAGTWPDGSRAQACLLLIKALPDANSKRSMQMAVELILRESGIETLKLNQGQMKIDVASRYYENGRSSSYSSFDINENDVKGSGETIRDILLQKFSPEQRQ